MKETVMDRVDPHTVEDVDLESIVEQFTASTESHPVTEGHTDGHYDNGHTDAHYDSPPPPMF